MTKPIDMAGQTYGRLTVISRSENSSTRQTRWKCRCLCGNEVVVLGRSLKTGNTSSCGTCPVSLKSKDMSGVVVGRLTVVQIAERPSHVKNKSTHWLCSCSCGGMAVVSRDSLAKAQNGSGGASSCGCYNREAAANRLRGENNINFNSSLTDEERAARLTSAPRREPEYIRWCREVYKRGGYYCFICGERRNGRGKYKSLHAHHLNGWNCNAEARYDPENGVCLCPLCHKEFHTLYGKGNNTADQFREFCIAKESKVAI